MVFEDTSSALFQRDVSTATNAHHLDNTSPQRKTFYYYLTEWNWFYAPFIAHICVFLMILALGLIYDKKIKPQVWNSLPFLIFGLINMAFPFLITLQRKIETNTWSVRSIKSLFTSCTRDEEELSLLASTSHHDLGGEDYNLPNRPYEKAFKYILFGKASDLSDEDIATNPPPSFVAFQLWLGLMFIMTFVWLGAQPHLAVGFWVFPTYALLGLAVLLVWKKHGLLFGILSVGFILSALFLQSTVSEHKKFTVLEICAPLFIIPAILILASIFAWVFSNSRVVGMVSIFFSSLFALWFLFLVGFIHNYANPNNHFKALGFPASLSTIPAAVILVGSCLSLFIRLV